jgi:hypothetical protein
MTDERRKQLKIRIERYRRIRASFDDPNVTAGTEELIAKAEAKLAALIAEDKRD